jgi:hypothetical protein
MSRLEEMLQKDLQYTPPAMGFKQTSACPKPHMALLASLAQADSNIAALSEGAEAIIVEAGEGLTVRTLKAIAKALAGLPWGLRLMTDGQALKQSEAAGVDFIVFSPEKMPLSTLNYQKLGKILTVKSTMDGMALRTANELPVDAVIAEHPETVMTWEDLITFRRFADILTKPLLVTAPADISEMELKTLWENGVDGIILTATKPGQLKEMRRKMDGLCFPPRRKSMRLRAMVPVIREPAGLVHTEEEGEEEEEE